MPTLGFSVGAERFTVMPCCDSVTLNRKVWRSEQWLLPSRNKGSLPQKARPLLETATSLRRYFGLPSRTKRGRVGSVGRARSAGKLSMTDGERTMQIR